MNGNTIVQILFLGLCLWLLVLWLRRNEKQQDRLYEKGQAWRTYLAKISAAPPTYSYVSEESSTGIAVFEEAGELGIFGPSAAPENSLAVLTDNRFTHAEAFSIVETSMWVDGVRMGNSSHNFSVSGAALGGIIAGPVGAVIGALALPKFIKCVELRICIDDLSNPWTSVVFFGRGLASSGSPRNHPRVCKAIADCEKWQSRVEILRMRANASRLPSLQNGREPSCLEGS